MVRGSHYIIGGSIKNLDELAIKEKNLALQLLLRPWPFIISNDNNFLTYAISQVSTPSKWYLSTEIIDISCQRNRNELEFLLFIINL